MRKRLAWLHKYTEIGAFLALFSFPFSEILHFLCDKTGGREGVNRHFVGGEQLSDCRKQLSEYYTDSCPSRVRQLFDSCPTAIGLLIAYFRTIVVPFLDAEHLVSISCNSRFLRACFCLFGCITIRYCEFKH